MNEVTKSQRVLLVVSYLAELSVPELQWLYRWIEDDAIDVARLILEPFYHTFSTLEGDEASYANLLSRVQALTNEPHIKALDVFIHVHGYPNLLWFKEGAKNTDDLGEDLRKLGRRNKLRALYSSACYGETHIDSFLQGGFRVASGAKGVNANGAAEYPVFLVNWFLGKRFKSALGAMPGILTRLQDDIARPRFPEVDSEKVIGGRPYTRITDPAD